MVNIRCIDCVYTQDSEDWCLKYDLVVKHPKKTWNALCFIPKIRYEKETVDDE